MHWYLTIKDIHISCVAFAFISFFTRGIWMIQESHWLQMRWVKIVPHLIDTGLLASGIALVLFLHQYPGTHTWLTVKLVALLLYIVVGSIALKHGKTKTIRTMAWIGALGVFFYMVVVALKRVANPLAW
ncbi:MAG TPA: hypothetical protein ENG03_08795 [Thioploca sp.]|nr:MAG: hypothetical protein DRR19_03620 [Gammaproteobacteria bacterium]HDN27177.1 hypothetical protein [Thioploca sp.]